MVKILTTSISAAPAFLLLLAGSYTFKAKRESSVFGQNLDRTSNRKAHSTVKGGCSAVLRCRTNGFSIQPHIYVDAQNVRSINKVTVCNRSGEKLFERTNVKMADLNDGLLGAINHTTFYRDIYIYWIEVVSTAGKKSVFNGFIELY